MSITIRTNNRPRPLLDWSELTAEEQKELDWITEPLDSGYDFSGTGAYTAYKSSYALRITARFISSVGMVFAISVLLAVVLSGLTIRVKVSPLLLTIVKVLSC